MSHFEDALQMNINLDRQHEMIRGNVPELDRMHDFYNQQRLINAIQMGQNERNNMQNGGCKHFGARNPQGKSYSSGYGSFDPHNNQSLF